MELCSRAGEWLVGPQVLILGSKAIRNAHKIVLRGRVKKVFSAEASSTIKDRYRYDTCLKMLVYRRQGSPGHN